MLLQAKGVLIVTGLVYGGGVNQLVMQIIDLVALVTWAFTVMFIWMKVSNLIIPIGPPSEIERHALDATQMRRLPIPDSAPPVEKWAVFLMSNLPNHWKGPFIERNFHPLSTEHSTHC
jgi:hypothetical protein